MESSESVADNLNEIIKMMNEGKVMVTAKRNAGNTTPTSIRVFAHNFQYVYNM